MAIPTGTFVRFHFRTAISGAISKVGMAETATIERELYTLKQVADLFGVSLRTVESLVARGYLESSVLPGTGRTRRVSKRQLQRFLDRHDGLED